MTSTLLKENPFVNLTTRGLVIATLIIQGCLLIGVRHVADLAQVRISEPILIPAVYILFFGLLSLWELLQLKRARANLTHLMGQRPREPQWLPRVGLVIMILLFSLSSFTLSVYLLSFATPEFVRGLLQNVQFHANPPTAFPLLYQILTVASAVIVAPITEEFIFRGILFHRWATKWGIQPALISSSLLFGALHPHNMLGLSMFGLVMGLLYIQSRSLLVPIACHALNNLLAVGLAAVPRYTNSNQITTLEQFRSTWWIGLLFLLLSTPWLLHFIRRTWPRRDALVPYSANANHPI